MLYSDVVTTRKHLSLHPFKFIPTSTEVKKSQPPYYTNHKSHYKPLPPLTKFVFAFSTKTEIQLLSFIKKDKMMCRIMNA